MKSRKVGILASICTLVLSGSMAHSLGFLQALQHCSFCPSFSYLPSHCWCSKWHLVEPEVWARCPKWQLSWKKENVTGGVCCQAMCPLHVGRGSEQVGSTSLGKVGSVWVLPEVDQSPGLVWIFLHFWFCFSYICSYLESAKFLHHVLGVWILESLLPPAQGWSCFLWCFPLFSPQCLKPFVSNSTCPSSQLALEISVYK